MVTALKVLYYDKWKDSLEDNNQALYLARLMKMIQYSFSAGFIIGGYIGARKAGLQFMAEHQHNLSGIRTRIEASAYLRQRNSRVILGAAREGLWRGSQLALVASIFASVKWTLISLRNQGVSSVIDADEFIAGAFTGSIFTLVGGKSQRVYHLKKGLLIGGGLGLGLCLFRHSLEAIQAKYFKDSSCPSPSSSSSSIH